MHDVVLHVVQSRIVGHSPKPGWNGRRTLILSAHGLANSKPWNVPAPWRNSSGSPQPAVSTTVFDPVTVYSGVRIRPWSGRFYSAAARR